MKNNYILQGIKAKCKDCGGICDTIKVTTRDTGKVFTIGKHCSCGKNEKAVLREDNAWMHSYEHEITREVVNYIGEPNKFGLWLSQTKKVGAGEMRAHLGYLREKGIKEPKYLMAMCKAK